MSKDDDEGGCAIRYIDDYLDNMERRPGMYVGDDEYSLFSYEASFDALISLRSRILGQTSDLRTLTLACKARHFGPGPLTIASCMARRKHKKQERLADLVKIFAELRRTVAESP